MFGSSSAAGGDIKKAAAEKAAAEALVKSVEDATTGVKSLQEDVKSLKKLSDDFKDVDVKKVLELIEQLKTGQDNVVRAIRQSKHGLYVPGLGDNKEEYSITRVMNAIVNKNWELAPYEKKVNDEARKAAVAKGSGSIVGVDSQGGFFVPDQVIPDLIAGIYAQSVLISLDGEGRTRVSILDGLTGMPVHIPKFIGGMIAYWIGEQDKYVQSAAKVGNVQLSPRKMGVLTRITEEMMRFSSPGFESLLQRDMMKAAAQLLDYTIIYGSGTANAPRGVFAHSQTKNYYAETHSETAPSGSAVGGELGFDDLDNMRGVVEDANIPVSSSWAWIAHSRFFRRMRQTKVLNYSGQTTGQPYLLNGPLLTDQQLSSVIGDFGKLTTMPTTNTAGQTIGLTPNDANDKKYGDVVGANWDDVIVGRWGGIEILEDTSLGFITDEKYVKLRLFADVGYRRPESIVKVSDAKMR